MKEVAEIGQLVGASRSLEVHCVLRKSIVTWCSCFFDAEMAKIQGKE